MELFLFYKFFFRLNILLRQVVFFKIILYLKDIALLENLYNYLLKYFLNIFLTNIIQEQIKVFFFSKQTISLNIWNIKDIDNIVISFFDLYPVLEIKKIDYNNFKNIYNIILSKGYLSSEGLAQI